jgi:hypothetical protein
MSRSIRQVLDDSIPIILAGIPGYGQAFELWWRLGAFFALLRRGAPVRLAWYLSGTLLAAAVEELDRHGDMPTPAEAVASEASYWNDA